MSIVDWQLVASDLERQVATLTKERDAWKANAKECSNWGEERRQAALDALEMAMERKDQLAQVVQQRDELLMALKAIKPVMVRVSKASLQRVAVYPADEIDAAIAKVQP